MTDQVAQTRKQPRFPLFRGMRGIKPSDIPREALAGLTIACVAVPLGLGYGAMAGLPPEVGLYGTILPLAAYAILGSSRRIVMAPDSALALILAGSVVPLALGNADRALELSLLTALVAGVVLIAAGVLRIGRLAEFVSRPVLIGYLSGVGITVVTSQLDDIFQVPIEGDTSIQKTVDFLSNLGQTNVTALLLGLAAIVGMFALTRLTPNLPNALTIVIIGTAITYFFGLASQGVELVGFIPSGLPSLDVPPLAPADIFAVFLPAVAIATLSFVDSSLTARSFGARHGEDVDADAEAVGIGGADIAAAFSGGLPASGSGLRTSLAEAAGAHTQLAPLFSAGLLLLVLLFLTSLLALMPWPVLGGILVVAGLTIIDVAGLRTIGRFDRAEQWIAVICLLGVVFIGTFAGVFIAIFLSIFDVVRRLSSPRDSIVRPTTDGSVVVYRFEAPLFFPNAEAVRTRVLKFAFEGGAQPKSIVLDGSAITQIDISAMYALARLRDELKQQGVNLIFADFPDHVRQGLESAPTSEPEIYPFTVFGTVEEAVAAAGK